MDAPLYRYPLLTPLTPFRSHSLSVLHLVSLHLLVTRFLHFFCNLSWYSLSVTIFHASSISLSLYFLLMMCTYLRKYAFVYAHAFKWWRVCYRDLHKPRVSNYLGRVIYHSVFVAIYQSAVSCRHEWFAIRVYIQFSTFHAAGTVAWLHICKWTHYKFITVTQKMLKLKMDKTCLNSSGMLPCNM